jgi:glycosyltransferase involved in cell wall biosynthesis
MAEKISHIKICHITTVHTAFDVRIFHKECASLAGYGFDTYLIARHRCDETVKGVKIRALPDNAANGFFRVVNMWRAFRKAVRLRARVYHVHDPELIVVSLLIKFFTGSHIIYDAHEDVQAHALSKNWKGGAISRMIACVLRTCERIGTPFFSAVMIPIQSLAKFRGKEVVLHNYPTLPGKISAPAVFNKKRKSLVYLGGIREKRCPFEMIEALDILKRTYPDILLNLLGPFYPADMEFKLKEAVRDRHLTENVFMPGRVSWDEGCRIIAGSDIGLCVMYPDPDLQVALPTKMFEYMLYGKPVISSNFSMWKAIVDETGCGVTVDSIAPAEMAQAVRWLYKHPGKMKEMGISGQKSVLTKYSWTQEAQKLIDCYTAILKP